jgi:hypothetical protein
MFELVRSYKAAMHVLLVVMFNYKKKARIHKENSWPKLRFINENGYII